MPAAFQLYNFEVYNHFSYLQFCGIDQLWNIAVQAKSTEVSWAAITYLNSLYINGNHSLLITV